MIKLIISEFCWDYSYTFCSFYFWAHLRTQKKKSLFLCTRVNLAIIKYICILENFNAGILYYFNDNNNLREFTTHNHKIERIFCSQNLVLYASFKDLLQTKMNQTQLKCILGKTIYSLLPQFDKFEKELIVFSKPNQSLKYIFFCMILWFLFTHAMWTI